MTYELEITFADYKQLAIGVYGSDDLPPAFIDAADNKDQNFFIRRASPLGSLNNKGKFRLKRDAQIAASNLEKYNFYGLGFNRAQTGNSGMAIGVKVK